MVRSALERPTAEGLVTLHDGHRLYSVDTLTPVGRVYRLVRTVIHCGYEPGERFMTRFETTIVTALRRRRRWAHRLAVQGASAARREPQVPRYLIV